MVADWFEPFLARHVERLHWRDREDLPAPDSVFWTAFRARLVFHGVTEAVADEASERMTEAPPHLDHHHEVFITLVRHVWKDSEVATAPSTPANNRAMADPSRLWDEAAKRNWERLDEPTREAWRAEVRRRFPGLAGNEPFVRLNAIAWAYDPALAETVGEEPPPSEFGRGIAGAVRRLLRLDAGHVPTDPNLSPVPPPADGRHAGREQAARLTGPAAAQGAPGRDGGAGGGSDRGSPPRGAPAAF